jgi:hypothetical protein
MVMEKDAAMRGLKTKNEEINAQLGRSDIEHRQQVNIDSVLVCHQS